MLTKDAIRRIYAGDTAFQPTLQVLEVKRLNAASAAGPSAGDRYRMLVSDGSHTLQAMLATQLNALVSEDRISTRCVVRLDEFICNTVHDRQIAIVLQLTVVSGPAEIVGNPVAIEGKPAAGAPASAPPPSVLGTVGQQSYQKPAVPIANSPVANSVAAPGVPRYQAPSPGQQLHRAPMGNDQNQNIFPLSALNPFQNARWTVKVRVTHKGDTKNWKNERGEGRLMSCDILDSEGSKMRVTMFNSEVDTFEPLLQVGKSYFISKAQIKVANKKFNNLGSDYEMTLDKNSIVESAPDASDIPLQSYRFVPIADLANISADKVVDVIGMVTEAGEATSINTKRGTPLSKRTCTIVDSSMASIELTMWGKFAETTLCEGVLAIQGAKVSDWNAKSIGTTMTGNVESNPDLIEAHKLRAWFSANSSSLHAVTQLTQQGVRPNQDGNQTGNNANGNFKPAAYKTFAQIRDENLGKRNEPDYFLLNCTVSSIKHDRDVWYNACKTCNKKVTEAAGAGGWVCEKCNATTPTCNHRYILRVVACDFTGSYWINAFNDQGEQIMGVTATQLQEWKNSGDERYEKAFEAALFRELAMKCRAKEDSYNGNERVSITANSAAPLAFADQIKRLEEQIARYAQLGYAPSI